MRAFLAVCYILSTLASVGCANAATDSFDAGEPQDPRLQGRELRRPAPERVPDRPPPVTGEVSDKVMQRVEAALRAELGRAPRNLEVLVAEQVVWPSSALGCDRPGRYYQPLPVAGQRVVLRADGKSYDYRVAGQQVVLCDRSLHAEKEVVTP